MGATASRSSPTDKTTCLVKISEYSKLAREPVERTFDTIFFRDRFWNVTVHPQDFNEGLPDYFLVSVEIDILHRLDFAFGIDISIEILDETGKNTVFHEESSRWRPEANRDLILGVSRRELEASSCVHKDSFTVRCTLSKQATKWCRFFSRSKKLAVLEPQVSTAGSNTLTIGSFSKLQAALRAGECARSTHFAVGGCRWYFKFSPGRYGFMLFYLVRARRDETPTTAEFSFELEGAVNFESQKMTHTFDYANPQHLFTYPLEPSTSAMHDRLVVRCCLAFMVEKSSLPPAAISTATTPHTIMMVEKPSLPLTTIPTATPPRTESESVLTPLLSAMYD